MSQPTDSPLFLNNTKPWLVWLRALVPAPIAIDGKERWRAILGALAGVLFTAFVSLWLINAPLVGLWLLAPLGASTVLVFAAPASPLAQPWAVVGGNSISALVGVCCALWLPNVELAAALAVALAIAAMFTFRCLHPPGGAMALSAVLIHVAHGQFPVATALINSVLLVIAGIVYNSLTGRRYPHMQMQVAAHVSSINTRFKPEDLDVALTQYNQVLDVSRDDLESLLLAAELESYRRRMGEIRCKAVMSREVITVDFATKLQDAWSLMRTHRIKALPVLDRSRRIIGIITMSNFMRAAGIDEHHGFVTKLLELMLPDGLVHSDKPEVVGQIMTRQVRVVGQERYVVELMALFTDAGHHHIPVIDDEKRVVGMITQSDFVRVLYQNNS